MPDLRRSDSMPEALTGPHEYMSTGCLHGDHDYCNRPVGKSGKKKPAECKFCSSKCVCECHGNVNQ